MRTSFGDFLRKITLDIDRESLFFSPAPVGLNILLTTGTGVLLVDLAPDELTQREIEVDLRSFISWSPDASSVALGTGGWPTLLESESGSLHPIDGSGIATVGHPIFHWSPAGVGSSSSGRKRSPSSIPQRDRSPPGSICTHLSSTASLSTPGPPTVSASPS